MANLIRTGITVTNDNDVKVYFDTAYRCMDADIIEEINKEGMFEWVARTRHISREQAFFDAYDTKHYLKYHKVWIMSTEHPIY